MPGKRQFQIPQRLFLQASHAGAGVDDKYESMRARIWLERNDLNRFSMELGFQVRNRNVLKWKVLRVTKIDGQFARSATRLL